MAKHMTSQQRLEHACATLDPVLARQALAAGASAAQSSADGCPLPIEVLRACPSVTMASDRATLLHILFAAGAPLDPCWTDEPTPTPNAGMEILFDQAVSRSAELGWSTRDELRVLEAWLAAGNSPNPGMIVSGRFKGALDMLCFMLENMRESTMGEEETNNALDFLRGAASVLAAAQDPLVRGPLLRACFEPEDIDLVLAHHARHQAHCQEEMLESETAPARHRGSSPVRL